LQSKRCQEHGNDAAETADEMSAENERQADVRAMFWAGPQRVRILSRVCSAMKSDAAGHQISKDNMRQSIGRKGAIDIRMI
jgi:phage-related protein